MKILENKIFKLVSFLALVSAISGGLLAFVNSITAPIIENQGIQKELKTLEILFPNREFTEVEYTDESLLVIGAFKTDSEEYAYKISNRGYGGEIVYMIGVDTNNEITGYTVISSKETKGIGDKIEQDDFVNSIIGSKINSNFDTIAGSTISSTAVIDGISSAVNVHSQFSKLEEVKQENNKEDKTTVKSIELVNEDDTTKTYNIVATGMKDNTFEVIVDTATNTISSIMYLEVNDDSPFVDAVNNEEVLSSFIGIDKEKVLQLDIISGSTLSSTAIIDTLKAALNHEKEESDVIIVLEKETSTVYQSKAMGFIGENTFNVEVDNQTQTVLAIESVELNDTPDFVNKVNNDEYLSNYIGLTISDIESVDIVSGATGSSKSLKEILNKILTVSGGDNNG